STRCAVSFTPNAVGTHTITASYSGDTTHATSSGTTVVTGRTHATTTCRSCTPASITVGSATCCPATVPDATPGSATAPTRPVRFTYSLSTFSASTCTLDTLSLHDAIPIFSTRCAVSFTPNAVGTHTITASYSGDTTHATSSGTTVVTALTHATTTGVSRSEERRVGEGGRRCTATVTEENTGSATAPTGTVSFTNSGGTFSASSCTLGSASTDPATGVVTSRRPISSTPDAATHTITASYSGDTTHATSSGTTVVTALTHATTTGVS